MKPTPSTPVTITASEGACLAGRLAVPTNPCGLVVFAQCSGSSCPSAANLQVAEALQGAHQATLLLELQTASEAASSREGGHAHLDLDRLARRLVDATAWAGEQEGIRGLPPGYFGAGTCAAATLLGADLQPGRVGAIVSRGGRPDLAGDALDHVQSPMLLIVGGADAPVIAPNRQAFARLRGERELVLVPNATHCFEEVGAMETVTRYAVEWFVRYLRV